ncbi:helix-turn-helix transcriptional regulator [Prescottella agglutinans]|uniref:DNA-binding CsgD family transcriptional regulator/PAS domain-containing protein n=1 Tax=Prescottella agglutinans TaxID=1644129 RepID=A0ABT6M5R6_9NOCA|nr:helix-turn-helix transcriptional regulator [Prescottella agglutinans]MDH6279224.1 DNA-binding CsgD family transcriptional regulator/PAS domain-containing protein [Prescottella agglutinans]
MIRVDEFSRLVSAIYATAVAPEQWDSVLRGLVRTFDGHGSGLLTSATSARRADVMVRQVGGEHSARATYNEYYGRLDFVAEAVERGPIGRVHTGTELIYPHVNTEFYADWCRPNRFGDGLFVRLTSGSNTVWLGVAAERRSEPFGSTERLSSFGQLVPHLQQAIHTQAKLAGLEQGERDLSAAIELVSRGIVIIGPDTRILHLNSAAERIFVSDDGLHFDAQGSVAASLTRSDRELRGLMYRALNGHGDGVPSGGSVSCPRPSGRCEYAVHVVPLRADAGGTSSVGLDSSSATALVVIDDPDRELPLDTVMLRRLYALTSAEAEVALRVAQGDGLRPIAEEFSVSTTTIRTHLQHIFEKTATHRQAQLVRLLLSIGPAGDPGR